MYTQNAASTIVMDQTVKAPSESLAMVAKCFQYSASALALLLPLMILGALFFMDVEEKSFHLHTFHEIAILASFALSVFIGFVAFRAYKLTHSLFTLYTSLAYFSFGFIYGFHGLLTRTEYHQLPLFLVFGPVSRLVMSAYLVAALFSLDRYQNEQQSKPKGQIAYHFAFFALIVGAMFGINSLISLNVTEVKSIEVLSMVTSLIAIGRIAFLRINSPLLLANFVTQIIFVQASFCFLLARPWSSVWWLAHSVSAAGFIYLGTSIMSRLKPGIKINAVFAEVERYRSLTTELQRTNANLNQEIERRTAIGEELRHAKSAAEEMNKAKTNFLANMSHEIRTPLGAILGFADLMDDSEQSPTDRRDCLLTIKRNGEQLSRIINEILDISKVENDRIEIQKDVFSLGEFVEDVSTLSSFQAQEKGLSFAVTSEGVLPKTVVTDRVRLRQILLNVIGNAIKFTDRGRISLRIRAFEQKGKPGKMLEFLVSDDGPGMNKEERARLFRPFMQADSSMTRRHGGTGLGLALSKKLAQALGGDLELASSTSSKGSQFRIWLEAGTMGVVASGGEFAPHKFLQEKASDGFSGRLEGKKILVVDDSPDNRILISKYLNRAGATVETADDGAQGIEKSLQSDFDVVLMDIQMPVLDGFSAVEQLRQKGYRRPVVALTAHAMRGDKEKCLANGFDQHLSKPVDRAALVDTIVALSL